MKANEIPEKIYLSYENDNEDDKNHIFIDYMWHRHPFEGKNLKNIEYTRTDAIIKKACEGIDHLLSGYIIRNFHFGDSYDIDRLIEDFKNYIKGE